MLISSIVFYSQNVFKLFSIKVAKRLYGKGLILWISLLGQIGIALNTAWKEPLDEFSTADIQASVRGMEFYLGWFANPIFGSGDYPTVMKESIHIRSVMQGKQESKLPQFSKDEIEDLKGVFD